MSMIELKPLFPELMLLILACFVLIFDLFSKDRERRNTYVFTQVGLALIAAYVVSTFELPREVAFSGHYVTDTLGRILKVAILLISIMSLVYARVFINERRLLRGEYYVLTIFAVLGMSIMVSAYSLLTLYLGLELLSLTLYALIAMERDNSLASESAMKYFVTGAIASGFLLYGMSLLYGVTGHIRIEAISQIFLESGDNLLLARFSLVFLVAGIAFKLGLVPFHMWLPDVYQGAPTSVTAFIASAPKVAGYGFAIRLLTEGLPFFVKDWQQIILVAALMSIVVGNVIALAQTNFKRLLAYSGIAHMGYFALGIYAGDQGGYAAAMFYVLVYSVMTLAAFGIIIFMSKVGYECDSLDDFNGLGRRNIWYGFLLTLVMISMAGIPPLLGFWPKLEIFRTLISAGHINVAIFAILFSVIGLFYYLRVIKVIFFTEPEGELEFQPSRSIRFAITFNGLMLLALGLVPGSVYQYCIMAFSS